MVDSGTRRLALAYPELRRFAFVVADSDMDPEDVLHEALVRLLRRGHLDEIRDLELYGRRAISNEVSNRRRSFMRRRRAVSRFAADVRDDAVDPEWPSDLAELMHLGPTERAALYMFVVERRSHREIADVLGVAEGTSSSLVSRALVRLRAEVAEEVSRGDVG